MIIIKKKKSNAKAKNITVKPKLLIALSVHVLDCIAINIEPSFISIPCKINISFPQSAFTSFDGVVFNSLDRLYNT
jgi:hypothetical protein